MKIVFINCREAAYIDMMFAREKVLETRSRDTLRAVIDEPVVVASTGDGGKPCCCGVFIFRAPLVVRCREDWEWLRPLHCVPVGSSHDWKPDTVVKYLYPVEKVGIIHAFFAPEGIRHGRTWMECPDRELKFY